MANPEMPRRGLRILGLGALACIGCCAGPVLAFLGGLSIAGLASTALIGVAGLVIAAVAAGGYLIVRHRRAPACDIRLAEPVLVALSIAHPKEADDTHPD